MAADDDRGALLADLLEQRDDLEGQLGVEVARRLVGQDDLGVVDDGPGDGHALLLAVGQAAGELPHLLVEVDLLERGEDAPADLLAPDAHDLERHGDVLEDRPVEHQAEVLEDDAHRAPQGVDAVVGDLEDVDAVDQDLALGRQGLPEDRLEQGRLARAARPGDEVEVAVVDLEGDVGEGPVGFLVLLPDVKELDHSIS
ncbi:MAG: hypothetical protein MZV64_11125 [Ignavibacteriales bacterium]|nr:hypothetical protein [Ignavibacteriales bacterium]